MNESYWLVALFARWSYDRWSEMNDGSLQSDPAYTDADSHEHVLSAIFERLPSPEEIMTALHASRNDLANRDGKSEILSYMLMKKVDWQSFLGAEAEWFYGQNSIDTPCIHLHYSLSSAQKKERDCNILSIDYSDN